ncbi:Hypothetical protein NGAL_HAMBI1189_48770 [Neorhizobium galegae bv. officinalis]|uniref:Uncharacterized protein n=1 Tax=Neorhizobium galegae bv. officinalis TaxID=323656 RepID=A0A0T7H116_NEOGA|nr:Hypothetical protein NGAL_HAMBI1189_48770 [Neorhizobium galegae bv. officinalis]
MLQNLWFRSQSVFLVQFLKSISSNYFCSPNLVPILMFEASYFIQLLQRAFKRMTKRAMPYVMYECCDQGDVRALLIKLPSES